MSFYEMCAESIHAMYLSIDRVLLAHVYMSESGEFVLILDENGLILVYELPSLKFIGQLLLQTGKEAIHNIIAASAFGLAIALLTYSKLYLIDLKAVLEAIMHKKDHLSLPELEMPSTNTNQHQLLQFTNKQIKLVRHREQLCLKFSARIKDQIVYYFFIIKSNQPIIDDTIRFRMKFESKVSLESFDKDIIVYEAYVSKFKPIKAQLIRFIDHYEAKDSQMIQDLEIYQFQERYSIHNAYKISQDLLCFITSSHFDNESQSNIILYNFRSKFTVSNIVLKNFIVFKVFVCGEDVSKGLKYDSSDLALECIGYEDKEVGLKMVRPYSHCQPASTIITPSDHYYLNQNYLILHSERNKQITVHRKISKKAIYFAWLKQEFSPAFSIFRHILELL